MPEDWENSEEKPSRAEVRLVARAIRKQWPISDEVRELIIDRLVAMMQSQNETRALGAARAMIMADAVNVRREANQVQAEGQDRQQAQSLMVSLMRTPEGRAALASLSCQDATASPLPELPASPEPPDNLPDQ